MRRLGLVITSCSRVLAMGARLARGRATKTSGIDRGSGRTQDGSLHTRRTGPERAGRRGARGMVPAVPARATSMRKCEKALMQVLLGTLCEGIQPLTTTENVATTHLGAAQSDRGGKTHKTCLTQPRKKESKKGIATRTTLSKELIKLSVV